MKKRFPAIVFLCFFIIRGIGQSIHYSNNNLNVSEYRYKIIGKVNNNIIVWATDVAKNGAAKIFVYDNTMRLINTINTNIQTGLNADAQFFIFGNTFQIVYPYKTKDAFLFRLSVFNEKGNLLYDRTLDSAANADANQNTYYQILHSQHNKAVCFTKMLSDRQHHVLKFSFNFIDGQNISSRTFTIPFYEDQEDITDILLDDDKNILLLKQRKLDSAINITLIKLNFADNLMLGANKTISNYFFKANSMHIVQKADGYTVFGLLRKENRNFSDLDKKEGLYVWQTDNDLDDVPGDAILNQETQSNLLSYSTNIPGNNVFSNVFAIWNTQENYSTSKKNQWTYAAQYEEHSSPGYDKSNLIYYEEELKNATNPVAVPIENDGGIPSKLALLKIDNSNKMVWQNVFTDKIDNITTANLNNAKIITGNNSLHIVYEVLIKDHPRSLSHITVQPGGAITEKLFINPDKKYKYDLTASVFTSKGELIVPCYKGSKINFARLKLE